MTMFLAVWGAGQGRGGIVVHVAGVAAAGGGGADRVARDGVTGVYRERRLKALMDLVASFP